MFEQVSACTVHASVWEYHVSQQHVCTGACVCASQCVRLLKHDFDQDQCVGECQHTPQECTTQVKRWRRTRSSTPSRSANMAHSCLHLKQHHNLKQALSLRCFCPDKDRSRPPRYVLSFNCEVGAWGLNHRSPGLQRKPETRPPPGVNHVGQIQEMKPYK